MREWRGGPYSACDAGATEGRRLAILTRRSAILARTQREPSSRTATYAMRKQTSTATTEATMMKTRISTLLSAHPPGAGGGDGGGGGGDGGQGGGEGGALGDIGLGGGDNGAPGCMGGGTAGGSGGQCGGMGGGGEGEGGGGGEGGYGGLGGGGLEEQPTPPMHKPSQQPSGCKQILLGPQASGGHGSQVARGMRTSANTIDMYRRRGALRRPACKERWFGIADCTLPRRCPACSCKSSHIAGRTSART